MDKNTVSIELKNYRDFEDYLNYGKKYRSEESNIKIENVKLKTGSFNKCELIGKWENVVLELYSSSIIYKNFTFKDCIIHNCFLDLSIYKKCKFINCKITGETIRWVHFINCEFENVEFNVEYIRCSKIDKKSKATNLKLSFEQIDEYIWLFGKRYNSDCRIKNTVINQL